MRMIRRNLSRQTCLFIFFVFGSSAVAQGIDECPTEINGALRGESGNIQDNMFHSLAIDPTNENVVYAGTETSGIFKTTDGGISWARLRVGLKCTPNKTGYSQIVDIAIDPTNPQVVYASTINGPGPASPSTFPSASGGVYKSTDGGLTWTQKNQGFTNTYVTYVLIDSTNPNRLYAGVGGLRTSFSGSSGFADGGIWVSNNGGDSWTPLTIPAGVTANLLIDMIVRGSNQRTIYASAQSHGTDAPVGYGLIRSTDGGATWSIVNPPGQTISGFDVFRGDPNIIYGHDLSTGRRVHRSTDGGNTWTQLQAGFFGVVRMHPTSSPTMYITGRTSILKTTDGFATQREVFNDPDLPSYSQMTDIKISLTNPNVVWAAAKGYYLYKTVDGGQSWTKTTAIRDMIYGNPLSYSLPALVTTSNSLTGIAVVNTDTTSAVAVTLASYENNGSLSRDPVSLTVPPKGQVARLSSEVFGTNTGPNGSWVKVTANRPGIKGFFLSFDPALTTMDGAPLSNRPVKELVIPDLQNAEISLVNGGSAAADVTLKLIGNEGAELASPAIIQIPPNGRYVAQAGDLFPLASSITDAYVRITSSQPLIGSEQFGVAGQFTSVVNALAADLGSRYPYSPQYVVGGGYRSTLTLVNLEDAPTSVAVIWSDNNGNPMGQNVRVSLPARGRTVITNADPFAVNVPESGLSGYLTIGSNPTLITGSIQFGDSAGAQFQATLPLVSSAYSETTYAHVAQDSTYFTGVAIINRNSSAANVTISIFNSSGVQVGTGRRTIVPNGRISELLSQIDPNLAPITGGYFKVTSDRAVLSFGVFGTKTLSVLAAIPGQQ